jgi:hypothetical protein
MDYFDMSSSETKQPFFNDDGTVAVDCMFVRPDTIAAIAKVYRTEFEIDSETPLKIEEISESLLNNGPAIQALINLKKGGRSLFKGFSGKEVNLAAAGLSEVRFEGSLHEMFMEAKSLIAAPTFDTSRITSVESMFYKCYKLKGVPLYDLKNCTNFKYMFKFCQQLRTPPALDVSSATAPDALKQMFYGCNSLSSVPLVGVRVSLQIGGYDSQLSKTYFGGSISALEVAKLANRLVVTPEVDDSPTLTLHSATYDSVRRLIGTVRTEGLSEDNFGSDEFVPYKYLDSVKDPIPEGYISLMTYLTVNRRWGVST